MKMRSKDSLSQKAEQEISTTMKKTKSLNFTLRALDELHSKLRKDVASLEGRFSEENLVLPMLLAMPKP